jgi:hypothetical protein
MIRFPSAQYHTRRIFSTTIDRRDRRQGMQMKEKGKSEEPLRDAKKSLLAAP